MNVFEIFMNYESQSKDFDFQEDLILQTKEY